VDEQQARELVAAALSTVAPEADLKGAVDQTDLQTRMDLDSIDIEEFFAELERRAHVRIEEDDYPQVRTLGGVVAFLTSRTR
jgi:acyl carrier protein